MTDTTQTHAMGEGGEREAEASDTPRPKLVDVLSQDVTPQVDGVAKQLIANGDALLVKTARTSVHGFVLDQEHYDTRLDWTGPEFSAICSCETRAAGFVCPHLWATVLLADRSGAFRALEEAHTHAVFNRGGEEGGRKSASAWPARPGWKIHLASIAQAAGRRGASHPVVAAGLPRQALYVVDGGETQALGGTAVVVELQSRHQKKARVRGGGGSVGAWTKGSLFRLDADEIDTFTEAEDRDILARLVGARAEGEEGVSAAAGGGGGGVAEKVCRLRGTIGIELLKRMCLTGRARLRLPANVSGGGIAAEPAVLRWSEGAAWEFLVRVTAHEDGKHYTLTGHLRRRVEVEGGGVREEVLPLSSVQLLAEPARVAGGTNGTDGATGLAFVHNEVSRAKLAGGLHWLTLFAARGPLHVPRGDAHEFLRQVAGLPEIPPFDLPEELHFERVEGAARPRLVLKRPGRGNGVGAAGGGGGGVSKLDERVLGTVLFDYEAGPVEATATAAGTYDSALKKMVLRDRGGEAKAMATLQALGFRRVVDEEDGEAGGHEELPPRLLPSVVPALIREGWVVEAEGKLYRAATDFRVSVSSGIDWFDLSGSVQFGEQVVPLPRLLAAARKGEHLIKLADGTFGVLPEEWLAKYGVIVQSASAVKTENGEEALRFSKSQAGMLDVLLESQPHAAVDAAFAALRSQLKQFAGIAPLPAPKTFSGQLRPYQEEGLGWFSFLRQFSFGGCLADDMGLGKTIQVLALLAGRKSREAAEGGGGNGNGKKPSLVVSPRSLVFNWREEAEKFAPGLRILDHTGPGRTRSTEKFGETDIILTTYGTLRSDVAFLKDYTFDYAILDEAQAIKNAQTESAKAVRLLKADYRLALSGTPVQNHLGELWSLFEFLNPGMLGMASVFDTRFAPAKPKAAENGANGTNGTNGVAAEAANGAANGAPVEAAAVAAEEDDEESPRQLLARALRPFILRRTKEQVAQDLPPCTEQTIYCELDDSQRQMYDELRDHYRQSLLGAAGANGKGGGAPANKMQVLEALLRLRQAALPSGLIDKTRAGEPSAKLEMLFTQLESIVDEGHKALVFSQFTSLLAIVRKRLDERPVKYAYLDGKTRDRKSPVEQFQNDPDTRLFLISLKAGGLGLNLTGADYVFLLDPWWNPAVEAQAIDRAHRIGQTRHVFAYRLIAKGTVEEKVLQLQQTKRDLADAILSEDNALLSNLTSEDLAVLLS